jgi:hypothetical protein
MGRPKKAAVQASELQGFKYFRMIDDVLRALHSCGTERDKAGNRELFYDQYAALMLLYYFTPTLQSLRGIQQATTLEKVQKLCGIKPTALGSLSEAARVFDPELLKPVIAELAWQARHSPQAMPCAREAALANLIAVDGSLLPALPKMAWALWQDPKHRAAKMHVAFHVMAQVPLQVSVTAGNGSERSELRKFVEPGGFYVNDRGYADYSMFREFDAQNATFLTRIQENAVSEIDQERPLSAADRAAGVVRDVMVRRLGTEKHNSLLERPLRIVEIRGSEPDHVWILATNARDLSAELIRTAYQSRWQIELFFRWLKCVLGCKHLLSGSESGVTLQVYFAIIAALLIGLWVGVKPDKRTYEMLCFYLAGWATLEELERHLQQLRAKNTGPPGNS